MDLGAQLLRERHRRTSLRRRNTSESSMESPYGGPRPKLQRSSRLPRQYSEPGDHPPPPPPRRSLNMSADSEDVFRNPLVSQDSDEPFVLLRRNQVSDIPLTSIRPIKEVEDIKEEDDDGIV